MQSIDRSGPPSLPTLLRLARAACGREIRLALAAAGYDDIPERGLPVLGVLATCDGAPMAELVQWLAISKQAAGQLVDMLVLRGYATREPDAEDRRRLRILPSARGHAAAQVIQATVRRIEADLAAQLGPEAVLHARATLQALADGIRG